MKKAVILVMVLILGLSFAWNIPISAAEGIIKGVKLCPPKGDPIVLFKGGKEIKEEKPIALSDGIELGEKERVKIQVTFNRGFDEDITLNSDLQNQHRKLVHANGRIEKAILSGRVPPALVERGREKVVGERSFVLIDIVGSETFLDLEAIATNHHIEEAKRRIAKLEEGIAGFKGAENIRERAGETLKSSRIALEKGNPELSIRLSRSAEDILGIDVTPIDIPNWYLGVLALLATGFLSGWIMFFRKGRESGQSFSIKGK